jgi:hypothetical protein
MRMGMCAYEFEDGKIQEVRTVYDWLTLLQQSATGWLESRVAGLVVSQAESALQ